MTAPKLLTSRQVAEIFGWSLEHWRRQRPKLEAAGFPGPVTPPGTRWDPVAIERWLARQRGDVAGDDWQGELEARLEAG